MCSICFNDNLDDTSITCRKCNLQQCAKCILQWNTRSCLSNIQCCQCSDLLIILKCPPEIQQAQTMILAKSMYRIYKQQCPLEGCADLGWIDGNGQCLNCNNKQCMVCKEMVLARHQCHQHTLASQELISATSKLCPGCFAPISKDEGCFMMFCTRCKTCFEWGTLSIVHCPDKNFHNPYYNQESDTFRQYKQGVISKQTYEKRLYNDYIHGIINDAVVEIIEKNDRNLARVNAEIAKCWFLPNVNTPQINVRQVVHDPRIYYLQHIPTNGLTHLRYKIK